MVQDRMTEFKALRYNFEKFVSKILRSLGDEQWKI